MHYEKTKYQDLSKVCIEKYGESKGKEIYNQAEQYMEQLLKEADYRKSEMVKWHMQKSIFPVLAYYKALLDSGYTCEEAYKNVLEQTQRYALISKEKNKKIGKIPGAYSLFRIGVKKVMKKSFPVEGWETQWVKNSKSEIHFNLKRCVYHETVSHYGCPELCTVFCQNDTTAFSGYLPKIVFQRSGTIGEGKAMCDFHFINSKYIEK